MGIIPTLAFQWWWRHDVRSWNDPSPDSDCLKISWHLNPPIYRNRKNHFHIDTPISFLSIIFNLWIKMGYAILQFMAIFIHFPQWPEKKYPISPWNQAIQLGAKPVVWHGKNPSKIRTIGFRVFRVFPQIYPNIMANLTNNRYNMCIYIYNMGILNGYYYRLIMVNSYHGQSARYPATK